MYLILNKQVYSGRDFTYLLLIKTLYCVFYELFWFLKHKPIFNMWNGGIFIL